MTDEQPTQAPAEPEPAAQPPAPEPTPTPAPAPDAAPPEPAPDAAAPAEAAPGPAAELERLRAENAQLAARAKDADAREAELKDRLVRLQADFENFRRRAREESTQAAARGKESFLKALLPVLDNLDRALAHAEDEGLRLLARQLQGVLEQQGVGVLSPEGGAFDAKLHEAIAQEQREGVEPGRVLTVVEKGYTLEGRVLRPARVVVAA